MDLVYPILAEEIRDAHMMRDLVEYHKYFQKEVLKAREEKFGSYATPDFSVVFEKSREANIIVVGAIQSLSNLTDGFKMLSRDFAERILGNANKIFMSLESTQTAIEAERYWGEEITRKQTYQASEGYTNSGRYLSPLRYLNPQRSKSLQDRKGWIEGWEPRIKADEFIHGLGIGEAYLRYNGRPAKVKLIRADINPPEKFDLSDDLPRFSQGNEPPLNLTEKVNRVVMSRMNEAKRTSPKERGETASQVGKPKRKNQKGKPQSSHGNLKDGTSTITPQDKLPEIVSQPSGHKDSIENAPNTPHLNCHQPTWIAAKSLPLELACEDERSLSSMAPGKTTKSQGQYVYLAATRTQA